MRQTHRAGEKVFVDFSGDIIEIVNPFTGGALPMKPFGAAMGASNYPYAEACPSEGLADWIKVDVNLFAFLGGAPKFVICDNLSTAIRAARPRRPKDTAKVEVAVQIAQRWILARLRNRRFFCSFPWRS